MRLTPTGLGIGTINPDRPLHLHVASSAAVYTKYTNDTSGESDTDGLLVGLDATESASFWLYEDGYMRFGVNNVEAMRIEANTGFLGINITNPVQLVHVHEDSSAGAQIQYTNTTTGSTLTDGLRVGLDGAEGANFWLYENDYMRFATNNTERMRIGAGGFVGIGTTTAQRKLHIHETAAAGVWINLTNGTTTDAATSGVLFGMDSSEVVRIHNYENTATAFYNNNTEWMRLTASGRLGLNTTAPDTLFHMHEKSTGAAFATFTNDTTGQAGTDGLIVGLDSDENAAVWLYENKYMVFGTNSVERLRITAGGLASFGAGAAPSGQLHVKQPIVSGGPIPVLTLEQVDVSEEMIEFLCPIGVGNAIEAVGAKTLTVTHFVKVTIEGGLTRYLPVGTIA
jgi:hypothetical protein